MTAPNDITWLGETTARAQYTRFGIRFPDRRSHLYILGQTGTGKTTLLLNIARQDICAGRGIAVIDPHGDFVERLATGIPEHRKDDLVYLNVPDPNQPYGYNPLQYVGPAHRSLAASGLLEAFHKLWPDAWGQRMEHILRNALLALLESEGHSLLDVLRILRDNDFRRSVARDLENEVVRDFWLKEYEKYSYRLRADAVVPIQNKVGAILADPVLRRILTAAEKPLRIRTLIDKRTILLVNLARGRLGTDSSHLLGALLVTVLGLAAYSRSDTSENDRQDYGVIVDEFQNFTTKAVADMASELRKFRLHLILANQYIDQLDSDIRDAVLANAGTLISFRVGPRDAQLLEKEYEPYFSRKDLLYLPNHHIYLKLMIDGAPSRPFSAATLPSDGFDCSNRENFGYHTGAGSGVGVTIRRN